MWQLLKRGDPVAKGASDITLDSKKRKVRFYSDFISSLTHFMGQFSGQSCIYSTKPCVRACACVCNALCI